MPRPERVLDSDAGPLEAFAVELRELRRRAGTPGYRRLAEATGLSVTTLANAAAGRHLPSLPVVLKYVGACGGDPDEWRQRWQALATCLAERRADAHPAGGRGADGRGGDGRGAATPSDAVVPYLGLVPFGVGDAGRFFGRERLVELLLGRIARHPFTAVVGASGIGKSSLLRAGLVAALTYRRPPDPGTGDPGPRPVLMVPGPQPVAALRRCLAAGGPDRPLLVVVDQFEEVYTACGDQAERRAFVGELLALAGGPDGHRVVLGIRADFYATCAEDPALAEALAEHSIPVGPMTPEELGRIVTGPARLAGLTVERALVTQILADTEGRPGSLPLLSHALQETWRQRQGATLTLAGYRAAGGLHEAISGTAERVHAALGPAQRRTARHLLIRLTTLGDDGVDTRRRVERSELDLPEVVEVIDALVAARLLVVDDTTVEIAHEALLHAWPRLAEWLAQDREALRTHRQLTEAAAGWAALGYDPGALYRGARLAIARERLDTDTFTGALTGDERRFLEASVAAELAERTAEARRTRRWQQLTAALGGAMVLVLAAAGLAVWQWRASSAQRQVATSRLLAAQALAAFETDPGEAMRLALRAYQMAPTVEARSALLTTADRPTYAARLPINRAGRLTFAPDGHTLAVVDSDGRITLRDLDGHAPQRTLGQHGYGDVRTAVAFGPDGSLFTGGGSGTVEALDPVTGDQRWRTDVMVSMFAVSPDGATVAATAVGAVGDGTRMMFPDRDSGLVLLYRATDGRLLGTLHQGSPAVKAVGYSPDGRTLTGVASDGTVLAWDVATLRQTVTGHAAAPADGLVTFAPDGTRFAVGRPDGDITVWQTGTGTRLAAFRAASAATAMAFGAGGNLLATAASGGPATLWDVARQGRLGDLRTGGEEVTGLAVSPDGGVVAAATSRTVQLWRRGALPLLGHTDEVTSLALSADGRTLVTTGADRRLVVWDPAGRQARRTVELDGGSRDLALGPDGHFAAVTGPLTGPFDPEHLPESTVQLWDLTTGALVRTIEGASGVGAFDRTGGTLLTGPEVRLWDVATGARKGGTYCAEGVDVPVPAPDWRTFYAASGMMGGGLYACDIARDNQTQVIAERGRNVEGSADLTATALDRSRTMAALGHNDGTTTLWNLATRTRVATLPSTAGTRSTIAFSPDGTLLATAGNGSAIELWSVATHRRWATLTGTDSHLNRLVWAPDGRTIYTAGADHTVTAWSVDPAATVRTIGSRLAADYPALG